MATTSLWRVKGYIGKVLLYAENPDKTTNPTTLEVPKHANRDSLEDVIAYAGREEATNMRQLVWGINCTPQNARKEMMAVKEQYDKTGGTIAYHGYQSFKEGEVTPEQAHEIGVALAMELWGDRYQVLVATHLDKDSHTLRNKLKRVMRTGDEAAVIGVKQEIAGVTAQMQKIKNNFKICDSVEERSSSIRKELETLYQEQERKEISDELFGRRGGTSRENVTQRH